MKSITLIVSHYESLPFLQTCIRKIRKYKHPEIEQKIIICDQSEEPTREIIRSKYISDEDIQLVFTKSLWSGYGIDYCLRYADIQTDYVAQIHTDAFPINRNWIKLCTSLIEEDGYTFVGQMQLISLPTDTIYPPVKFFSMAAAFNMAKTEHYRELSLQGGFTRFHNRVEAENGMTWESTDWPSWASSDYYHRGSDDDVPAFCWEDAHREHNKLGLAITGMIGSHYGRVLEDIIFHFCSCKENRSNDLGSEYSELFRRVQENYDDALVEELLSMVKPTMKMEKVVWDGVLKKHFSSTKELDEKIERLKNEKDTII